MTGQTEVVDSLRTRWQHQLSNELYQLQSEAVGYLARLNSAQHPRLNSPRRCSTLIIWKRLTQSDSCALVNETTSKLFRKHAHRQPAYSLVSIPVWVRESNVSNRICLT